MAGLLVLGLLALVSGLALRFDPLVYLFYALVGVYLLNRLWLRRSLLAVRGRRGIGAAAGRAAGDSDTSAFLGDRVEVRLEVVNSGWLPVAWLTVQEYLPRALRPIGPVRWALSLGPRERRSLRYQLHCAQRGYYPIGPLSAAGGTPWEAEPRERALAAVTFFTVYPHIVPLDRLGLPSRLPLGTRRTINPILPDPSRLVGVRDYQPGDRLRDMHWRATARLGALQVKKFEPSQPLQVGLFLDLDGGAYDFRTRDRASELAIVVAASIAAHLVERRHGVGLFTNGRDPLAEGRAVDATAPRPVPIGQELRAAPAPLPEEEVSLPAAATAGPLLPATERLTAGAAPALTAPAPRPPFSTDAFAPSALPEATFDEDASVYIDGPAVSGPPAAPVVVPIHDGQGHLSVVLTILARIARREPAEDRSPTGPATAPALPFTRLVRRRAAGLPWGTTVVLITAAPTPELVPTMFHLRQGGFSPLAIFVQRPRLAGDLDAATVRAAGFPAFDVYDEGRLADLALLAAGR